MIFDLLKGNIKQNIYFLKKKSPKLQKTSPHTQKNAGGVFSTEYQMGHILKAILVLHLRIVLFGLGLNFRTYSKMCSSYHMKIMEKVPPRFGIVHPKT